MLKRNIIKWRVRRVLLSLPRKLARLDNSVPNFQLSMDLFIRYTAASAEVYPEKEHLAKLLKDLNTIRDSKRCLSGLSKKEKKVKVEEAIQVAG